MPRLNRDIADEVATDHISREAIDETGAVHMLFWDGRVRSVLLEGWPAEQAKLSQKEADRQQTALIRQQVLATFTPMVGRTVTAPFTARELQAWLVVVTHKLGGVGRGGELLAPGDWAE